MPRASRPLPPVRSSRCSPGPNAIGAGDRASVVEAYARLSHVGPDSHAAAVLTRCLADPDAAVRLAATARLHCAGALVPPNGDLDELLAAALASDDPATRHVAMDELRAALLGTCPTRAAADDAARWTSRLALLAARLADARDRARAAEIQADLAARHGGEVAAHGAALLSYAADPDPRVRAAVLRFVGAARLDGQVGWVVERLASNDEDEAAAAAAALRAFGPSGHQRPPRRAAPRQARRAASRAADPARPARRRRDPARPDRTRGRGYPAHPPAVVRACATAISPTLSCSACANASTRARTPLLLLLATLRNEERFAVLGRLLARSPHGRGRAVLRGGARCVAAARRARSA